VKKWIAAAFVAAGLTAFGGVAIAQDAASRDGGQGPDVRQEEARPDGHEGCRFGGESSEGKRI